MTVMTIPPPLPGSVYSSFVGPSLNFLIVGTVWSAILVPLLVMLLFFSTPKIRRQPIFLMNVFAVFAGIIIGIMNLQLQVTSILNPFQVFPTKTFLAYLWMIFFIPVFVDCILAFRLYVVYPPQSTSKTQLMIIFLPIIIFKICRMVNLIVAVIKLSVMLSGPNLGEIDFQLLWGRAPYPAIEWTFQVLDNWYASGLFLYKIWRSRRRSKTCGASPHGREKMKNLFYFALSSFVFPSILSVVQVIIKLVFRNKDFFPAAYLIITNVYVEIIGVLLATIWTTRAWYEENTMSINGPSRLSQSVPFQFAGHGVNITAEVAAGVASRDTYVNDIRTGGDA